MKFIITLLLISITSVTLFNCKSQERNATTSKKNIPESKEVYKSATLIVTQISENSFLHTSYKQTNDFGNVPCNGLVVRNNNETIVFDTPTNDSSAHELIKWITQTLRCRVNAIIPTHFHDDCLGGLNAFHENKIPSYAYFKTIELAKATNVTVPQNSFTDSLLLRVGTENTLTKFFGEGHTKDNVIGYFASENVMFGGCLIKEVNASKGYLGDANLAEWSGTVEKIKKAYPQVKIVIPGHGEYGSIKLLDYTINLFKTQ
jgi:metallo-beta-lactamase class B